MKKPLWSWKLNWKLWFAVNHQIWKILLNSKTIFLVQNSQSISLLSYKGNNEKVLIGDFISLVVKSDWLSSMGYKNIHHDIWYFSVGHCDEQMPQLCDGAREKMPNKKPCIEDACPERWIYKAFKLMRWSRLIIMLKISQLVAPGISDLRGEMCIYKICKCFVFVMPS